jgi:glycosyltransferase involved in cell wall biosynthesis
MGLDIHMYPSTFRHESRILRITGSLTEAQMFDQIHILATWEDGLPECEALDETRTVYRVRTPWLGQGGGLIRKTFRFLEWSLRCLKMSRGQHIECVHPHSLSMLPMALAFRLLTGCKVVYDTHEFEPETIDARGVRKLMGKVIERCAMPFLDRIVVTSDGFGQLYEQVYGVDNVVVVKNYPLRHETGSEPGVSLKQRLGIPEDELLFIYQGLMSPGRGIDLMLPVFERGDTRKHLVFMGFGRLMPQAEQYAARCRNIHVLPGVAPHEVVRYVSTADVGFCLIERTCLSYYHTLPNKLLESLQGGVPVIVSDFPDMGAVIDQWNCGWKVPVDVAALAALVESINPADVARRKIQARRWAEACYWEREVEKYLEMLQSVLERTLAADCSKKAGCGSMDAARQAA